MDEHLIKCNGEGGIMAMDNHGGGVADEADIDAGGVDVDGRGVVVCGDHGDRLPVLVLSPEMG